MKVKIEKLPNIKIFTVSVISSIFLTGATFSYNFAAMIGQTSIIAPIAGAYPVLYVIVSRFLFKDKLTKQQIAGILITLSGIVALSFLGA